ncbi:hypothetical protein HB364_23910 [Pseudoflavitalea sp. X16]|uniref:hypothetical protein n=1 Tax=Paraflavitalea devenefica TaxID=2716334 RepID=UPI00141DE29A|nr:hypothetical protein [Paraflavitalea devenefica]NII28150.1 hypothetical protein [Paraflavitalea devenefica]
MLKNTLLLLSLLAAHGLGAQTVTGSWFGRADVVAQGNQNNYLTEFILKQKGNEVEGIFGYYFKDSYQSFFIRGTYNKSTRAVHIPNLAMFHYSSNTRNGVECPMNFSGTLMVSQAQSSLKGSFITEPRYKYTCPEIRVNFTLDNEAPQTDVALGNTTPGRKFWKPQQEDVIVSNTPENKPVTATAVLTPDSLVLKPTTIEETASNSLLAKFESRKNIYSQELEIEGDSIRVSFYDNGDVDNDTVSVLLNKSPILVSQELTARALTIYIALDDKKPVSELGMMAENLGKYPPNTALMVVTDGIHRYEMYLSSSLTQNAVVRLRKKKKS